MSAGELEQTVDSAMRNGQPRAAHVVTGRAATPPELAPASADAARLVDPHDWPAPRPLPAALPAVAPFHPDLLPESLRPWSQDIAERVQCPPDFPAVALMITLATVVGRKVGIRPKRRDDWLVVPNLWGAVCGPPGVMKTPAIQEPLRILNRMEIQAKAAHDAAVSEFAARQLVDEQRRQVARGDVRAALKSGEDALAIAMTGLGECARPPARRRYLLNDATIEKLGEILRDNPNGVLLFRDELVGFLRSLD